MTEQITVSRRAGYTAIPNHIFSDVSISLEARAFLGLVMSMSEGWKFRRGHLCKQCGVGRDKYRRIVSELQNTGYLEIRNIHNHEGRFAGTKWVVHDNPPAQDIDTGGLKTRPAVQKCTGGLETPPSVLPVGGENRPHKKEQLPKKTEHQENILSFSEFWKVWPNKDAKAAAEKAWKKLKPEDRQAAIGTAASWFAAWRARCSPDTNPIQAASYLDGRRWNDKGAVGISTLSDIAGSRKQIENHAVENIKSGKRYLCQRMPHGLPDYLVEQGLVTAAECDAVGVLLR